MKLDDQWVLTVMKSTAGEICHQYSFSCNCNYSLITHNKTPVHSTWGLLSVCAACPTPRLNLSSEIRPSWEQHPRYVSHWVRNRCKNIVGFTCPCPHYIQSILQLNKKNDDIKTSWEIIWSISYDWSKFLYVVISD